MELSQAVKQRILKLADERKVTLHKLSLDSGISYSTLNSFMNGKCKSPNLVTILHLCEGFGIELNEFFTDKVFKDVEED